MIYVHVILCTQKPHCVHVACTLITVRAVCRALTFLLHPLFQLISTKTNLNKILIKPLKTSLFKENFTFVRTLKQQQQQILPQQQEFSIHEITSVEKEQLLNIFVYSTLYIEFKMTQGKKDSMRVNFLGIQQKI